MSEEKTVEDFLDEAAAARAEAAGVVPAKAEDEGKSATPKSGEDTADHAEDQDEGDAPESEEEAAEEQEAKGDDSEEEDEKPKPRLPSKAQKRIRRLVRERDAANARLEQREAELRVLLQQHEARAAQKPNGQAQPQQDAQPKQEDYDDYAKFIAETAAWAGRQEARKALESERAAIKQAQTQNRQDQAEAQRVEGAQTLFEKGVDEFEDFDEVAGVSSLPVTDAMSDAIMDMEEGHKVLYHLGSNPDEAQRISKLRPVSQVRELTKLEASLSAPKKAAPRKATSATEPIKPVKAGGAPNKKDPDSMSMDEYMRDYRDRQRRGEITV